jgi:pyruvate carboxylase
MRIASGETLADLGISQDDDHVRGAALQCRITTEDPANGFRPDTGEITRLPLARVAPASPRRRHGVRRRQVSPHFDSMLVKLTCRGRDFATAVPAPGGRWPSSASAGSTNIPFLQGGARGPRLRRRPRDHLVHRRAARPAHRSDAADRGTKLLTYLADVTVNQPHGPAATRISPRAKLPTLDRYRPPPAGSRAALLRVGPRAVRRRAARPGARGGHRHDLPRRPPVAARHPGAHPRPAARRPHVARVDPAAALGGGWGGATYDVALRFLAEDPWERLAAARGDAQPAVQMLLRGRNTVGYTPYPTTVTDAFVAEAAAHRHRHLPHLRLAQRRRPDAPGHRRGARHRHRGRRGRPVLHRQPARPR